MQITIHADKEAKQLTITVHGLDWEKVESGSFAAGEETIQELLAQSGRALTPQLLESNEVNEGQLGRKGRSWYRKAPSQGHYQTLYGPVTVRPHTYQRSDGGQTFSPLEAGCQMSFGTATPLLAKVLAVKLSALTPREVRQDLETAHLLSLSASFIEQTAPRVGEIAVTKARCWRLESPEPGRWVATIATGVDGTTMPLGGCDHKEAMCGTIAL